MSTKTSASVDGRAHFGVVVPTYDHWTNASDIVDVVHAAESLGFGTVWLQDHIVMPGYAAHVMSKHWYEPLTTATYLLGATTSIRVGIDVLILPYRNPVWLSQIVAAADHFSGGRFTLGVGVGYLSGEFSATGAPPYERRGSVTDEYLDVMRKLWTTDGAVSHQGEWISFDDVHASPQPLQDPLPVWVGGNGRRAIRRAAKFGDGWHPLYPSLTHYASSREEILRLRAEYGRTGAFTFSYSSTLARVLTHPEETVPSANRRDVGNVPAEFSYAPPRPTSESGRPLLVGTADQVAEDVVALQHAGVEQLTLRFTDGRPEHGGPDELIEQMSRFAEQVLPLVADHNPAKLH